MAQTHDINEDWLSKWASSSFDTWKIITMEMNDAEVRNFSSIFFSLKKHTSFFNAFALRRGSITTLKKTMAVKSSLENVKGQIISYHGNSAQ